MPEVRQRELDRQNQTLLKLLVLCIRFSQKIYPILILFTALIAGACNEPEQKVEENWLISFNVYAPDSTNDDNYEVFTMNLDGTDKQNITKHPDMAWSYTALNNKILFVSDRDTTNRILFLYEMDFDGKNVRRIADYRLRDSWMSHRKNGEELIVTTHPSIDSAFYIINRNGDLLKKVHTGLLNASDPAFAPDGKLIAFRGGNKKSKREEGYIEAIYLIDENGANLRQLTSYPIGDTTAPWFAYKAGPPRWHPSGEYITYQSYQSGKYSLYAVTPDGKKHWKLTDLQWFEGWHSWRPDGKWLAIEISDNTRNQFHIGVMNWETKDFQIYADSLHHFEQAPSFIETR